LLETNKLLQLKENCRMCPGQQPGVSGQAAGVSGQQPDVSGQQPDVSGQQPDVSGQQCPKMDTRATQVNSPARIALK
jgi:hypothetical protein